MEVLAYILLGIMVVMTCSAFLAALKLHQENKSRSTKSHVSS
jgi:hypothetical protein